MVARVLYVLGGLAFLAMAVATATGPSRDRRTRARAVPTVGRVVDVEIEHYDEGGYSYRPVVEFTAGPDGRPVTASTWVPERVGEHMTSGEKVPIRYDPKTPARIWIEGGDEPESFLGVLFPLVFAVALFCQAVR
ncbi:MAG TPA: DUF3592 domain-containing protein [Actinoallomurus sp.]|jgi:hypothetical protein